MDVICKNGVFAPEVLQEFSLYGVVVPVEDTMYTIREVLNVTTKGTKALLLEEIVNPKIPTAHPVLGKVMYEPNWHIDRFRTLSGDIINSRELEKELSQTFIK